MKFEELQNEEMYVMVAPDGSIQVTTLAPDFAMCTAMVHMLHKSGMSKSLQSMLQNGFKVMPVKVTITQNGDEDKAFQKSKS